LYAIGQNFVFVLYTSMAQITVRSFLPRYNGHSYSTKGIAPTGVIVLVLLGRAMRQSERTPSSFPTLRATNPDESHVVVRPRRGHVSATEIDLRPGNPQHISIDVKQDTEVMIDETLGLDSVSKRMQRDWSHGPKVV